MTAIKEKRMFGVERDRKRWFSIVMDEKYSLDEATTEKLVKRVSFTKEAACALAFDLSAPAGDGPSQAGQV